MYTVKAKTAVQLTVIDSVQEWISITKLSIHRQSHPHTNDWNFVKSAMKTPMVDAVLKAISILNFPEASKKWRIDIFLPHRRTNKMPPDRRKVNKSRRKKRSGDEHEKKWPFVNETILRFFNIVRKVRFSLSFFYRFYRLCRAKAHFQSCAQ